MNYQQALTFIHSLDKFGSRPGLERVQKLFLKVPEVLSQQFIHIAGTNGKGSVSSMLSYVLEEAGYKTGLFISPYILEFRERIQINNTMISEEELAQAVEFLRPYLDKLNEEGVVITEFEFLTVLSFYIFKKHNVDIVVCEVGMGGLLDSTNLIPCPLCSVITRIDLDHTSILGETIEDIAVQKCGIIKRGGTVAAAAQHSSVMKIIETTAAALDDPLYLGEKITLNDICSTRGGTEFTYRATRMFLPLVGGHQVENLRCALSALEALEYEHGMDLSPDVIRRGLIKVRHPARFEHIRSAPDVILDGAHNPNGLAAFTRAVRTYYPDGDKTLIIGMLADKDSTSLDLLKGLFKRVITTDIKNPRAMPSNELKALLEDISDDVEAIGDPTKAYDKALAYGDSIFICGSLYLAAEIRPYILGK